MNKNIMMTSNAFSNNGGSYNNHIDDYGYLTKTSTISGNNYIGKMNIFINKKNLQIIATIDNAINNNNNDELIKLDNLSEQIYNSFITGLFVVGDGENILHTTKYNSKFLLNDSRNIAIDVIDKKKHIIIHQATLSCILAISKKISRLNKILL